MDPGFTPIPEFEDQFGAEFDEAFKWSQAEIIEFLKNVAADPVKYKAPIKFKSEFTLLYTHINSLKRLDGTLYKSPTPVQQLLRTQTALAPTAPMQWINDKKQPFFIIYDLLGIFLSLMGVPPTTQTLTATNYSLPLIALYGKWCMRLSNDAPSWTPAVAQITWATSTDGKFYPFLGANAIGFNPRHANWRKFVQEARWAYLAGIMQSPYNEYGYSPQRGAKGSPPENMKEAGLNFGNCAETYPFLYILADAGYVNHSYGISLTIAAMKGVNDYKGKDLWKVGPMKPPCENCQKLLEWYGVKNVKNFELYV